MGKKKKKSIWDVDTVDQMADADLIDDIINGKKSYSIFDVRETRGYEASDGLFGLKGTIEDDLNGRKAVSFREYATSTKKKKANPVTDQVIEPIAPPVPNYQKPRQTVRPDAKKKVPKEKDDVVRKIVEAGQVKVDTPMKTNAKVIIDATSGPDVSHLEKQFQERINELNEKGKPNVAEAPKQKQVGGAKPAVAVERKDRTSKPWLRCVRINNNTVPMLYRALLSDGIVTVPINVNYLQATRVDEGADTSDIDGKISLLKTYIAAVLYPTAIFTYNDFINEFGCITDYDEDRFIMLRDETEDGDLVYCWHVNDASWAILDDIIKSWHDDHGFETDQDVYLGCYINLAYIAANLHNTFSLNPEHARDFYSVDINNPRTEFAELVFNDESTVTDDGDNAKGIEPEKYVDFLGEIRGMIMDLVVDEGMDIDDDDDEEEDENDDTERDLELFRREDGDIGGESEQDIQDAEEEVPEDVEEGEEDIQPEKKAAFEESLERIKESAPEDLITELMNEEDAELLMGEVLEEVVEEIKEEQPSDDSMVIPVRRKQDYS